MAEDVCAERLKNINTHSIGFMILSFFLSLLWFRINNVPVFPIGAIAAVIVASWVRDIELSLGRKPLFTETIILVAVGTLLGFIIR